MIGEALLSRDFFENRFWIFQVSLTLLHYFCTAARRNAAARRGTAGSDDNDDRITRAATEKLIGMEDRLRGKITEHDDFGQLLPMSVEGQVSCQRN